MKIIDTIKKTLEDREKRNKKEAIALRKKRQKTAPLINKIAKEYGADVEILDTSAHVSKTVKGELREVHIPYGLDPEEIRNRIDRKLLGSSLTSQIKAAGRTVKRVKKSLKESGIKGGGMWEGSKPPGW